MTCLYLSFLFLSFTLNIFLSAIFILLYLSICNQNVYTLKFTKDLILWQCSKVCKEKFVIELAENLVVSPAHCPEYTKNTPLNSPSRLGHKTNEH